MGTKKKRSLRSSRQHKAYSSAKKQAHRSIKKFKKLPPTIIIVSVYILLILITAIAAAVYATSHRENADLQVISPFTDSQVTAAAFTLYYPAHLPDPLHIDPASLTTSDNGIVTMRITDNLGSATNRSFTISEQATPPGFNIATFNDGMDNKTTIKTSYGQATVGSVNLGQAKLATLATNDHTLLLIQIEPGVSLDDIAQTLQHLEPAKTSSAR